MLKRLIQYIRWYPFRSEDDMVRYREGEWWPWSRSDFQKNRLGQWVLVKK